jgi:hypothetical protein
LKERSNSGVKIEIYDASNKKIKDIMVFLIIVKAENTINLSKVFVKMLKKKKEQSTTIKKPLVKPPQNGPCLKKRQRLKRHNV